MITYLIKVFSEIIHVAFKSKVRSKIGFLAPSNQKLLFYYWEYGVQTRYWNPYGH